MAVVLPTRRPPKFAPALFAHRVVERRTHWLSVPVAFGQLDAPTTTICRALFCGWLDGSMVVVALLCC